MGVLVGLTVTSGLNTIQDGSSRPDTDGNSTASAPITEEVDQDVKLDLYLRHQATYVRTFEKAKRADDNVDVAAN